jgi:hypothetical protein
MIIKKYMHTHTHIHTHTHTYIHTYIHTSTDLTCPCGKGEQTTDHIICDCGRLTKDRDKLKAAITKTIHGQLTQGI